MSSGGNSKYSVIGGGERGTGGAAIEEGETVRSSASADAEPDPSSTRTDSEATHAGATESVGSPESTPASDTGSQSDRPADSAGTDQPTGGISQDELFDVLSNQRRRYLLHFLKECEDDVVELSDVSSQVAAWEQDTTTEAIDYADRKNAHTALYQFHLPKMADAGFVDYDKRSGRIELTDHARDLEIYLETVSGRDVPWGVYFLGLSAVATGFGVASWLGVGPLADLSAGVPALSIAVAFLVSSAVFAYQTHFEMRVEPVGSSAERE